MRSATAKQTRKRLDPTVRAGHILNVALKLFAERHYSMVSMRDIADACGINAGLIYYYYENKGELLRRSLGHAMAELQAGYEATTPSDPAQELTSWLKAHVPIAPMLIHMVKIMSDYAAANIKDDEVERMILDFYAREQAVLENCLRRGIAQGLFRMLNIEQTARAISLQLDGIFYASQARGDDRIAQDLENLCAIVASLTRKVRK
jgi:TetR/AcrR family transcriptional regulator, cholesterol catabolism regulator